jgi:dissimilatory sulfite reductase (desulfoviridin) alpha/beta subunit
MAIRLSDVFLEREPIGLAEAFAGIEAAYEAELETEEPAEEGETVYFGLPLPIEEIAEVKAQVVSSAPREGGHLVRVKALEADEKLLAFALKTLAGGAAESASGGPLWAKSVKQGNGSYAFLVNAPAGLLTAAQLEGIAKVAKENAGIVKLTHAQRVVILANAENMDRIEPELNALGLRVGVLHHGVRNIRSCCGSLCKWCKGVDAIKAAIEIDKALFGRETNFDVKIGVSDCLRNCSESFCADIGVLGGDSSYKILLGGRGAQVPFRAVQLAAGIKPEELPAAVVKVVDWYQRTAEPKERLWKTLERLGAQAVANVAVKIEGAEGLGDGIDELPRIKSLLARAAGAAIAREELGFNL